VTLDHLKHRFLDLTIVAFWGCQKEDSPVAEGVETMKYRFSDFNKVVICGKPEGRK
jgi:hypothetical protein